MKKIYLLFFMLAAGYAGNAQTFANAGMETWRTSTAAGTTVHAPDNWYGLDSTILAIGSTFAPVLHFGTPWNGSAQTFQENTIIHGGTSSAKLMTLKQDTLGFFPGVLSNAIPVVNETVLLGILSTGTGTATDALSYKGGTAVTERITAVSAWMEYKSGISSGTATADTGVMIVQAIAYIGGRDSVLGVGTMFIPPTGGTFVQFTAPIFYTDMVNFADTIRVTFASSGATATPLDSSTLYVDDVTMTGVPAAVMPVINNHVVNVYPNPASTTLNIDGPLTAGFSCQIYSLSGQVVITQALTGKDALNITNLPAGLYTYAIADKNGNTVQNGKVTVAK